MRSIASKWFETKIKYDKMMEDGTMKPVPETYVVDALSFTEAEERITEEMSSYVSGEFDVKGIAEASYKEIFFSDLDSADKWYKAKLQFITLDEKTGAEKRTNQLVLVQATDFRDALKNLDHGMEGTLGDWVIVSITETPIMDVFRYKKAEEGTAES
jgi:hypothetical protein